MFISRRRLRQTIEELKVENSILKSENEALNKASEKVTEAYQADMKKFQAEIDRLRLDDERWRTQTDELVKEIERLSRKRDEKGRYVKSTETAKPIFKVGDSVKIAKGFEPENNREVSIKYGFSFIEGMDENIGKTGKVIQLHESGTLTVDFGGVPFPYDYQPDWLEHAK